MAINTDVYILVDKDGKIAHSFNGIRVYPTLTSAVHGIRAYRGHNKNTNFYSEPFIARYEQKEILKEEDING